MRRRDFISLLGGAVTFWPLAARAQSERMRRIGVLLNIAADDPMGQARVAAFVQGLQAAGWKVHWLLARACHAVQAGCPLTGVKQISK